MGFRLFAGQGKQWVLTSLMVKPFIGSQAMKVGGFGNCHLVMSSIGHHILHRLDLHLGEDPLGVERNTIHYSEHEINMFFTINNQMTWLGMI